MSSHSGMRMRSGFAYTMTAQMLALALGFITSVLTARILGVDGKGSLAIIAQAQGLAAVVAGGGLAASNTYRVGRRELNPSEATSDSVLAAVVLSIVGVVVFLALLIVGFQGVGRVPWVAACISAAALPFTLLGSYQIGILVGMGRLAQVTALQVSSITVPFMGILVLAVVGQLSLPTVVLLTGLGAVAQVGVGIRSVRRTHGERFPSPSFQRLRSATKYSVKSWLSTLASTAGRRVDVIVLGALTSAEAVGIYSVGVVFGELLWKVPTAMTTTLLSRSVGTSKYEAAGLASQTARVAVLLMMALATLLVLGLYPLIRLLYSAAFQDAYWVVVLMIPGMLAYGAGSVLNVYLVAQNRLIPEAFAVSTAVNVMANLLLIPKYGARGAAAASAISYTVAGVWMVRVYCLESGTTPATTLIPSRVDLMLVLRVLREALQSLRRWVGRR